jgi:hypothetical protein
VAEGASGVLLVAMTPGEWAAWLADAGLPEHPADPHGLVPEGEEVVVLLGEVVDAAGEVVASGSCLVSAGRVGAGLGRDLAERVVAEVITPSGAGAGQHAFAHRLRIT